ncbi:hypothetical protein Droror1_Dr00027898 [Drosera rotundifolia]
MCKYEETKRLMDYKFVWLSIWIQRDQLLLGCLRKDVAEAIISKGGSFLKVDVDGNGEVKGDWLRIKVESDITKPLVRVTMVKLVKSTPSCVSISYEGSPYFCLCEVGMEA